MPYCEGSPSAQIWFKYPNELDWTTFNTNFTPVDYSCSSSVVPSPGADLTGKPGYQPHGWGRWKLTGRGHCSNTLKTVEGNGFLVTFNGFQNCSNGFERFAYLMQCDRSLITANHIEGVNGWNQSTLTIARIGDYSCLYKFAITDTRGLVFSRFASTCPIVVEVKCGDVCPPNTVCECDCGNMICCWDANGIPIHSFPN